MKRWLIICGISAVLLILFYVFSAPSNEKPTPQTIIPTIVKTTENPLGLQTGNYPWSAGIDTLKERLALINMPALTSEGTTLHTHQHLDIFIEGKSVAIPKDIGVDQAAGFMSPIHIHEEIGVIHVESPTIQTFTLGQFFNVWGVRFNNQCIGGYCEQGEKTLSVYVNGIIQSGNYADIALEAHQEIVVNYGSPAQLPNPIPSSYAFPEGE